MVWIGFAKPRRCSLHFVPIEFGLQMDDLDMLLWCGCDVGECYIVGGVTSWGPCVYTIAIWQVEPEIELQGVRPR